MSRAKGIQDVGAVLCLVCIMTFPASFLLLKVAGILVFLATQAFGLFRVKHFKIYPRLLLFYGIVAGAGLAWSLLGMYYGNSQVGINDALRLWCLWSFVYAFFFTLLRQDGSLRRIHHALVISGILISALNLAGLLDSFAMTGFFSAAMRKELDMVVGFHDGYIQITSMNIGPLFFIVPYLFALRMRKDAGPLNNGLSLLALVASILLAAVSGRRALWVCVLLAPLLVHGLSWLSSSLSLLKRRHRFVVMVLAVGLILLVPLVIAIGHSLDSAILGHFLEAFSAEDERTGQLWYLLAGFREYPIFGSGFAGTLKNIPFIRGQDVPWMFELTYWTLLFNLGVVGMAGFLGVFGLFMRWVIQSMRRYTKTSAMPFALLVGLLSFMVGVYSNPYLGSFDFLVYLGILPYLSTFRHGFVDYPDQKGEQPLASGTAMGSV